ncbi:hypothetical protein [Sorangium sp. So ce1097]|uniref:hypothetical protein n=1 Tax=Sorangium sp. So ce1097 TaxID=3133330 RepID=UPI003F62F72A
MTFRHPVYPRAGPVSRAERPFQPGEGVVFGGPLWGVAVAPDDVGPSVTLSTRDPARTAPFAWRGPAARLTAALDL